MVINEVWTSSIALHVQHTNHTESSPSCWGGLGFFLDSNIADGAPGVRGERFIGYPLKVRCLHANAFAMLAKPKPVTWPRTYTVAIIPTAHLLAGVA